MGEQRPPASVERIVDRIGDAFFALDRKWRFTYLNDRAESMLNRSREQLLGRVFWDEFPETEETQFPRGFHRAMETQEPVAFEFYHVPLKTYFEARAYPSESGLTVSLRDVTERKERERDLRRYQRIVEAINDGVVAIEADDRVGFVNSAMAEAVDGDRVDLVGVHLEELLSAGDVDADDAAEIGHALDQLRRGDVDQRRFEVDYTRSDGTSRVAELQLVLLDDERVAGVIRDVTESRRFERVVTSLHSVTPELLSADGSLEVASIAVHAAGEVLDLRVSGVWLLDDERNRLDPVAATAGAHEELGGLPHFPRGEGAVWRAFREGEPAVHDDVRELEGHDDDSRLRSQIVVPVGDHGVLMAGETTTEAFDDTDLELATILGANTAAALDRAERDRQLRRSQDSLERQTERLDVLERVLSDRVGERLADAGERSEPETAELERVRGLVRDAVELTRGGRSVRPRAPVEAGEVATAAAEAVDGVSVTVTRGGWLRADRERLLHLFETLFVDARRRAGGETGRTTPAVVETDGDDGDQGDTVTTPDGGAVDTEATVRVTAEDDGRLLVTDDAPPLSAATGQEAFELSRAADADGPGLGLPVAGEIAAAHGWELVATVVDGRNGFELREVTTLEPAE